MSPSTRAGRSRTFTEQARRSQILDAAIRTVNRDGYPRASLSRIAGEAGIAKSAIMYYFDGKDDLLLQVVDHVYAELGVRLAEAVGEHEQPRARLDAYMHTYLDHVGAHRAGIAAGAEIVLSHRTAEGTPLYLTETGEDSALLRGILEGGMAQGVFRPMPSGVAVDLVQSLLDLSITALQRDLEADLSTLVPEILTVISRGLATDPG